MNFMTLDPSVRWTLAGIGGVLIVATIIVQALVRVKPDSDFTSLRQRVNSWWVMATVFTLAMVPGFRPELVVATVTLAIISEMTGVVAVQIGASRRYDGPMGKSDRAFVFGLLCLLLGCGVAIEQWLDAILGGMTFLLVLTILNRSRQALKEIGK